MFKRIFVLILLLSVISLLLTACGENEPPTSFQANSTKADVDVRSIDQDGVVTFHIYSPSGIGDADIELTGGKMPETIQVRLYVDKLENLELSYGEVTITASASSNGPVSEKLRLGGGEADLAPGNPYWIDIQSLPAQEGGLFIGDPMLPASYLITLPQDFHESKSTEFTLKWVDFYR